MIRMWIDKIVCILQMLIINFLSFVFSVYKYDCHSWNKNNRKSNGTKKDNRKKAESNSVVCLLMLTICK